MSDARAESSTTSSWDSFSAGARAWVRIAFGFLAVVVSAALLVKWRSGERLDELRADYDRNAANLAEQVSLAEENSCQMAKAGSQSYSSDQRRPVHVSCTEGGVHAGARGWELWFEGPEQATGKCVVVRAADFISAPPFAVGNPSQRARRFDQVFLVDQHDRVLASRVDAAAVRLDSVRDYDAKRGELPIGARIFRVFVRPVIVPAECSMLRGTSQVQLRIYALVDANTLLVESFHIGPGYFLWAFFAFSLGVLLLPLAKLWLVGRETRFGRVDVLLVVICSVSTTLLITLVVLGVVARHALLADLDQQLAAVNDQLADEMSAKLNSAADLLDWFRDARPVHDCTAFEQRSGDCLCSVCASFQPRKCDSLEPRIECLFPPGCGPMFDPSAEATECFVPQDGAPMFKPPFDWNLVFWADSEGQQTAKLAAPERCTPMVNVRSRRYMDRALRGELMRLENRSRPNAVSAEVVRSATTGSVVLLAAIPSLDGRGKGIQASELPLNKLARQLLPLGLQTVVIDRWGRVMLHSDGTQIGQNLFAQLDSPEQLRSLITADLHDPILVEYQSVRSRVAAKATNGDWTVLSIAPMALVDEPVRQIVLLALLATLLLYVAVLLLALVGGFLIWLGRQVLVRTAADRASPHLAWMDRIWPAPGWATTYLTLGLSSVAGAVALSYWASHGVFRLELYIWWIALFLVIGAITVLFACKRREDETPIRPSLHFCYAFMCFGLSAFFVQTPATAFFATAFDDVVENQTRARQHHYAQQLRRLEDGDRTDVTDLSQRSMTCGRHLQHARFERSATRWLRQQLPWFSYPEIGDRAALISASAGVPCTWARVGAHLECRDGEQVPMLCQSVPNMFDDRRECTVALMLALFAVSSFIAYHSMGRMFFAKLSARAVGVLSWQGMGQDHSRPQRALTLFPSRALLQEACAALELPTAGGEGEASILFSRSGATWMVRDLAPLLADETVLARLDLLVRTDLNIILFCSVDWTLRVPAALAERWSALLLHFQEQRAEGVAHDDANRAAQVRWWASCDLAEKRLLVQLARQGCATPHPDNRIPLRHLIERGLLTTRLRFRHPGFADSVCDFAVREQLSTHETTTSERSVWAALRVPLSTAVAITMLSFGVTLPNLAGTPLGWSSVPTVLEALLKFLSHF